MAGFLKESTLREERFTVAQGVRVQAVMADRHGGGSEWRLWRWKRDPAGLLWVDQEMERGKCWLPFRFSPFLTQFRTATHAVVPPKFRTGDEYNVLKLGQTFSFSLSTIWF